MKTLTDALLRAWYPAPDDHGPAWMVVLRPLSRLFCLLAQWRRQIQRKQQHPLPVPVIVVGNLAVGGTGKTPLLAALASAMVARGLRIGIISRGYGGSHAGPPRSVEPDDTATEVGDEPLWLARRTGCPVVIGRDRPAAAMALCNSTTVDVILSDDGLQHYALPRAAEVVVIDGQRGLGNGQCLPAGPLREPPSRLAEVTLVVVNGDTPTTFRADQLVTRLVPEAWVRVSDGARLPLDHLPPGSRVHAVAGIGNPARFFATLRELGLTVIEHPLPDHHPFTAADFAVGDGLPVVMTEKDAVKCQWIAPPQSLALRVAMPLPEDCIDPLLAAAGLNPRRQP